MSFEYIRDYYKVPARRGMRCVYDGHPGTIVAASGPYLRIRLDGQTKIGNYHPTWKIQYLGDRGELIYDADRETRNAANS